MMIDPSEHRVVADTGGEKGAKLERHSLIPTSALRALATHNGVGAKKYEDRNWERGYPWSLSFDALMRHLLAYWGGEDFDEETGSHHLTAVAWHAMALHQFSECEKYERFDDRPAIG
jgi:hypothetical protein